MKIIKTIEEMKERSGRLKREGKSIGLVPTMGALHEGHLSLLRKSVQSMDKTVASLFVNPAQFAPDEDFDSYPRDYDRDLDMFIREGVDIVFMPERNTVYPAEYKTYVEVHDLQEKLCGLTRPIFFRGVCTIVLKLFNIINPDTAFFGQKDAQQGIIIKQMVQDLNLDVRIEILPIVRDKDGLALSSRNAYLKDTQRQAALSLSRSLKEAKIMVEKGEIGAEIIMAQIKDIIECYPEAKIDYIKIVDAENLNPLDIVRAGTLIALAVYVGKTRLIDNIIL